MDEIVLSTLGLSFKSASDAPCHLSLAEAEAWASGWNAAAEQLQAVEKENEARHE